IYTNIFGSEAATWQMKASFGQHVRYYLKGPGAAEMIDNSGWIIVPTIVVGFIYALARAGRPTIVRSAALAICILGAYAVPTVSLCKHGFYGLAFFTLGLFTSLLALRQIYVHRNTVAPSWRRLTV